jgi:hypothetical protein
MNALSFIRNSNAMPLHLAVTTPTGQLFCQIENQHMKANGDIWYETANLAAKVNGYPR